MTAAPPNAKGPRDLSTAAAPRLSMSNLSSPQGTVKAPQLHGLTYWLDYLGRLAERAKTDPAAVREVLIWSNRIRLGTGEDVVPGVLARSGGQP
jgi:hypothetical protein